MGDFNRHIGNSIERYKEIHEGHGWGIRNKDGKTLLEFVDSFNMVVGNMFFKKDSKKLIIFKYDENGNIKANLEIKIEEVQSKAAK